MSVAVVKAFRPTVEACWITTYNLDLGLFDGFLLPKLGDPPLNVVVLADGICHDRALEAIPADEAWRTDRINRRWLLRPVHHTAAFHPKTLLFVEPSTTTLLVGSGNLSDSGLDSGNEVFTTFTSNEEEGRSAIASWVSWMRGVVDRSADELLNRRFSDLLRRLPALPAPGAAFVHNFDKPLITQLLDSLTGPVDELLLTAPFFDERLEATTRLIAGTTPRRLSIFLGQQASLDGPSLQRLVASLDAQVKLHRYTPAPFVHAKLIGAIDRNGRGVLLSGSANASLAALMSVVNEDVWANYEVGVLAELPGDALRSVFTNPPVLEAMPVGLDAFAELRFRRDPEPPRPPLRILAARRVGDGRIALEVEGQLPEAAELTDGTDVAPLGEATLRGRLVWIVHDGDVISNRAVVVETAELESQLRERTATDSGRPAELYLGDTNTPLGAILAAMHQSFIMDVAETEAVRVAERAADSEGDDGSDTELWDRLAQDTLNYDPRASSYAWSGNRSGADSPLLELLAVMLSRAPREVRELYANVVPFPAAAEEEPREGDAGGDQLRRRWSESTRIRVRARNVLRRWADAIGDRRLLWIDPSAPLTNYSAMIDALCVLRSINHTTAPSGLSDEDLDDLTDRTTTAILAATSGSDISTEGLSEHTVASATALVMLALRPGADRRARLLHWQPRLRLMQERGLIRATSLAGYYLTTLFDRPTDARGIAERIDEAINFIDDAEWARRVGLELGLQELRYGQPDDGQHLDALIHAGGIDRPLVDPRTLRLLDAVRDYRGATSVAIYDAEDRWRLVIVPGETVVLRANWIDGQVVESIRVIDAGEIDRLVAAGSSLSELFRPEHRAA